MKSVLRKGDGYVDALLRHRFLRVYIHTGICGAFMYCVYAFISHLTPLEATMSYLKTMLGAGAYWFVMMSLVLYVFTYVSFKICGLQRPLRAIVVMFVLTGGLCVGLIPIKPMWWLDTALCFPCGMLMALYLPRVEGLVRRTRIPIMLVGVMLAIVGMLLVRMHMYPFYLVQEKLHLQECLSADWYVYLREAYHALLFPFMTVAWVLGVLWFFAGIEWKKIPSFYLWLGGPAVFYIFVLHFIPMKIMQTLKLDASIEKASVLPHLSDMGVLYPELSIVLVVVASLLMAYIANLLISKLDKRIFVPAQKR